MMCKSRLKSKLKTTNLELTKSIEHKLRDLGEKLHKISEVANKV